MKISSRAVCLLLLGLCLNMGYAGRVHAQGIVTSNVTWTGSVSFATTNNATYAEYSWFLLGYECESIFRTGPLTRSGNDFHYDFDLRETIGTACPQFILTETTPVNLGTLGPGTYRLITTSWGVPVMTNTLCTMPLLQPGGFDANGCFQVQMSNSMANVHYVLQCSTDLVTWVSVSTNTFTTSATAVSLTDLSPALPGGRYYRVLCQ